MSAMFALNDTTVDFKKFMIIFLYLASHESFPSLKKSRHRRRRYMYVIG